MTDAVPRKRSLPEVIDALETTENELNFQVKRLLEHVAPRTAAEAQYHTELREGYKTAAFMVRTLKRYHQGRMERLLSGGNNELADDEGAINAAGTATAYTGDSDDF